MERKDLPDLLLNLLKEAGGKLSMMEVFKHFWNM